MFDSVLLLMTGRRGQSQKMFLEHQLVMKKDGTEGRAAAIASALVLLLSVLSSHTSTDGSAALEMCACVRVTYI